jgi:hypothetical protein
MGHRRSEESLIFHQIHEVLLFTLPVYLYGPICPTVPPSPHKALKMVLPDVSHWRFIHRHARNCLKTYSDFSFPDNSNDKGLSPLGLF